MAWDDPSPRARGLPSASAALALPGYGDEPVSLGRLVWRLLVAAVVGVASAVATRRGLVGAHGHATGLQLVLSAVVGVAVGALAFRWVTRRSGGNWWWRLDRRDRWGGGASDQTFRDIVVAEAVVDVVEAAIDAVID